jgi:hypothetical protein
VSSGGPGTAALIMLVVVIVGAGGGSCVAWLAGWRAGYLAAQAYRTAAGQVLDAAARVVDRSLARVRRP